MDTTEQRFEKLLKNEKRGLITAGEAAASILLILVEAQFPHNIYDRLSGQIEEEVNRRLRDIGTGSLRWEPFLIGEPMPDEEVERINNRLRSFSKTMESKNSNEC